MGTNSKIVLVLFIVSVSTISFTCKKFICGDSISYSFNIYAKAFPNLDSINVGDTIWFEINQPTLLKDNFSGNNIDFKGAVNLGSAIGFGEFFGIDSVRNAANYFDYDLITGTQVSNTNTAQIREFKFSEINNFYVFKLGVIPKLKGIFGIGFSNATGVYRTSDNCAKADFEISFKDTDRHFYLNQNIGSDTTFSLGSYFFKVY
jgi:hypothetical protein